MYKASVISIYMPNIDNEVVEAQQGCVRKLLPAEWEFHQYLYAPEKFEIKSHAAAIEKCLKVAENDVVIILDIDCIPLTRHAFPWLERGAREGRLVGAVQRANHINNDKHIYVGPFCMAFSKKKYEEIGSPSFNETERGDCGEELTYRWGEEQVQFLWPSNVQQPMWILNRGHIFGYGTTYDNLFYHAFCSRQKVTRTLFLNKCSDVLNRREF